MSGEPGLLPPGVPHGPQTAWVRVFSECCLVGAAPGPSLGRLPLKVLALNLNHLITNKTKKSWFGLKITVRIPVKYWFMCSFRLRTSFLGWSIKPLLSILFENLWNWSLQMFRIISVKLIFIFSFEKVHFSAILCNFIWWQDCWLCAMHSMVKSTIFLVSHSKTMQRFVSITFWWLDVDITLGSVNFFSCLFFPVASFMWSSARDASAPTILVRVLMHFAT